MYSTTTSENVSLYDFKVIVCLRMKQCSWQVAFINTVSPMYCPRPMGHSLGLAATQTESHPGDASWSWRFALHYYILLQSPHGSLHTCRLRTRMTATRSTRRTRSRASLFTQRLQTCDTCCVTTALSLGIPVKSYLACLIRSRQDEDINLDALLPAHCDSNSQ